MKYSLCPASTPGGCPLASGSSLHPSATPSSGLEQSAGRGARGRGLFRALLGLLLLLPLAVPAQVTTNWTAYNDHSPGPLTAPYVSPYNLRGVGLAGAATRLLPTKGRLTNFVAGPYTSGTPLAAQIAVTASNMPGLFPNAAMSVPLPATPAYGLFNGIVDLGNADSAIGLSAGELDTVILTFTNLSPAMRYSFRGTAVRNGPNPTVHPGRWSICSILGAASFLNAHTPDVLTSATPGVPGLSLTNGQGVFQSGVNTNGEMVGWDNIIPSAAGTFSIMTRGYSGPVKGGTFGTLVTNAFDNLGYGLCGIMLMEYGPLTGVAIVTPPPASLTLTQAQTLSLSVVASGSAPGYQWYKTSTGPIAGAIDSTYLVPSVLVADAGNYYVVLSNAVNTVTSGVTVVSVAADNVPPQIVRVYAQASLDTITVEYSEPLGDEGAEVFNYSFEGSGPPLANTAVFGPTRSSVIITLTPEVPLIADMAYTLVAQGVTDLAGNAVPANTRFDFRSGVPSGANGLIFEVYRTIGGTTVPDLRASPLFPNRPAEVLHLTRFDTREVYPDDTHENYGGRISGLFIAPVSGSYKFYLRSDDSSELWLNPGGAARSGKVLIAAERSCCNPFVEDSPGLLTSVPIPMTAGHGYYIEALYKEGGGGDLCQVAAKLENDPTDPGTLLPLTSGFLGLPTAPAGIGGAVFFTLQPSNATVTLSENYIFAAAATNTFGLPLGYQWRKDGLDIPGATSQSYTGTLASALDDGATFSVAVSAIGSVTVSTGAVLTVLADTNPPTILSVMGNDLFDKVVVVFSEPPDPTTAADDFNYVITGGPTPIAVSTATLLGDGRTVILAVTPRMEPDTLYTLTVSGVMDIAGNPYAGGPINFRTFALSPGFLNFAVYDAGGGTAVSILTSHPTFPDQPRERLFLSAFDTRLVYSNDTHESYGGRISGVFIPPTTGNWIFYLRSDDSSELHLNPNGTDPAGKILLTAEAGCCNPFSAHASAPQPLVAGTPYYIEALYKEGGGGDFCQVAAKLETDPTSPDVLKPIPGAYLAAYIPLPGAPITILSQPSSQTVSVSQPSRTISLTDFALTSAGYRVTSLNAPGKPWTYSATTGSWTCGDMGGCAVAPRSSRLTSPNYTVTSAGMMMFSFTHRYSFEDDGSTQWDGGQVRYSVNRSAYLPVPLTNFTANGYNGTVGGASVPNTEISGQAAFVGASPGHGAGTLITSTAVLGPFSPGDLVSLQFLGAWDDCSEGAVPNWEIKTVEFEPTVENREADDAAILVTIAEAAVLFTTNAPVAFQWQRLSSTGYVDIAEATLGTYSFVPTTDEDGLTFRAVLRSPGDADITTGVTVHVVPKLSITSTGANVILSWPAAPSGYSLEATGALLTPSSATVWTPVGTAPVFNAGYATVTLPISPGQKFFRLTKP